MIRLALEECRKLGLTRVLMTCDKNNIGSAKSIIRNGGILENEVWKKELSSRDTGSPYKRMGKIAVNQNVDYSMGI